MAQHREPAHHRKHTHLRIIWQLQLTLVCVLTVGEMGVPGGIPMMTRGEHGD